MREERTKESSGFVYNRTCLLLYGNIPIKEYLWDILPHHHHNYHPRTVYAWNWIRVVSFSEWPRTRHGHNLFEWLPLKQRTRGAAEEEEEDCYHLIGSVFNYSLVSQQRMMCPFECCSRCPINSRTPQTVTNWMTSTLTGTATTAQPLKTSSGPRRNINTQNVLVSESGR